MRRLLCLPVLLAAAPARADDQIPAKVLADVKAATVFVKVRAASGEAFGSGFVIRAAGDEALVVTNEHVINPKPDDERVHPFGPFRPPPPPRFGPRFGGLGDARSFQLVFQSGRKDERAVGAELLAADAERDLAILKVTGLKALPPAIDLKAKAEPAETMAVWTFGFPFGGALSPDERSNPAVTVGKAAVSSIREDSRGELAQIQLEGELNPGNSGGPVVDAKGRLVGVAVAKVRGTRIGMAVPAAHVTRLLEGNPGRVSLVTMKRGDNPPGVRAVVQLADPLGKAVKVAVRYVKNRPGHSELKPNADGTWPPLPDADEVELTLAKGRAEGALNVPVPEAGVVNYVVQIVVTDGDRQTRYGPASTVTASAMRSPKANPQAQANPNQPPAEVVKRPDILDEKYHRSVRLGGREKIPACLCWTADSRAFFMVNAEGTVRRLSFPELAEDKSAATGKKVAWLALSAEGLVLALPDDNEVWLLDADTLAKKGAVPITGVRRVVSAPGLSVAFASDGYDRLAAIDLKGLKVVKEYGADDFANRDVRFERCVVAPDGKCLYTAAAFGELVRLTIDGARLKQDAASLRIGFGPADVCLSPDGRRVALASAGGNLKADGHALPADGGIYVYGVDDLRKPLATVAVKPPAHCLALDAKGRFYANTPAATLAVFDERGALKKEYGFDIWTARADQILPHPDGGRLLMLGQHRGDTRVWSVEVPKD